MTIKIKLLDSTKDIEKKINRAIAEQINKVVPLKLNSIINSIVSLIPKAINSQPEIISMMSSSTDSLAGYFGFNISPSDVTNAIINSVSSTVSVKFTKYKENLAGGGLIIQAQPSSLSNLLSLPEGHVIYEGGDLHWMDWLLIRGDSVIVVGYEYNPRTGLGRSNLGNMIQGSSFRVPPQYSGTQKDNFITRALSSSIIEQEITKIFQTALR